MLVKSISRFARNTVDGTTMKKLVDRIIVHNEGIEVEFKCGVSITQRYQQ